MSMRMAKVSKFKVLKAFSLVILLNAAAIRSDTGGQPQRKDDQIDPTDILNFDQVNMRMKNKLDASKGSDDLTLQNKNSVENPTKDELSSVNIADVTDEKQKLKNSDSYLTVVSCNSQMTALLQQYSMMLVNNLESLVGSTGPVYVNLRLKVSEHDLYKLREYGLSRRFDPHEVHEVLSSILQYAEPVEENLIQFYWLEQKLGLSTSNLLLSLSLTFFLLLLLKMIHNLMFTLRTVTQILIILFFLSVVFTWIAMYQEILADQDRLYMQNYTSVCQQPKDQTFLERTWIFVHSQFSFKDDKCQEFYKSMFVNPIVKVSPLEAVAVAVVKTLVSPARIVGSAISDFLTAVLKDLPLQYQFIVLAFIIVLIFLLIFIIAGYEINSFLISIQKAKNNQQPAAVRNSDPPAIENIKPSPIDEPNPMVLAAPARHNSVHAISEIPSDATIQKPVYAVSRTNATHIVENTQFNQRSEKQFPQVLTNQVPHANDRLQTTADTLPSANNRLQISSDTEPRGESNLHPKVSEKIQNLSNLVLSKRDEPIEDITKQQESSVNFDSSGDNITKRVQELDITNVAEGSGDKHVSGSDN
ncbi:chloride channel CLIC-like protein 1 isoform X2 [Biomphalaria glabrata]|uniref:Chloride channel CLIC-like protein 1 n=1 Tax=Biomphalaria glabrata TaxID=6526 RepID=A0A9U8EEW4_BIOGL|nr:chloride channel CLIC-like protein 1 isoform X2 [Biomphalaria glabrata]